MSCSARPFAALLVALSSAILPAATQAGELGKVLRGLAAPLKAANRQPPATPSDPCIEDLGARIDWLEHHLDCYGSIVAKQPDVWGQSRLTRHRAEYDQQMQRQLGLFTERTSAAIRTSDQAFLGLAMALQSASGRRRTAQEVAAPEAVGSASVINSIQGLIPTTNEAAGRADPIVIARTAPFGFPQNPVGYRFDEEPLSLEPTVHLDQLSRYLNHLNELRRVNEGDDTADSPGYALNLVRIPVSVLPGGRTRKGHGAEITVIAEPCLGDDLLPTTFKNLVINDLVDMIAPALTWCVNDRECLAWATTITAATGRLTAAHLPQEAPVREHGDMRPASHAAPERADRQGVMAAMQSLKAKLPTIAPSTAPSVKTRRARLPIPFSQLADVSGIEQIAILIRDTHTALTNHPANNPCIDYLDVRGYLAEELEAAYDFLALDGRMPVWQELPAWNLAALVRGRHVRELAAARCRFFSAVGTGEELPIELIGLTTTADATADPAGICCEAGQLATPICRTTTAVLAWGILVESALLNDRLTDDIREAATARGHGAPLGDSAGPFYGPDPAAEARAAFNDYVRCRWPIRVFALDPVSEEQNVDDSSSRRRELQIAMAMASASGPLNMQAMQRYTRRLELDMASVALNKTAVGFSHGSDTFGWRFYPRVQSPPTRGTLATLGETVCGGPTTDGDLMQRQLEPGQRECTAIIVMPSFVPWVTLDVRTNWFSLAHPKATDPDMQQTLVLSRSVKAMQSSAAACARCAHLYRDGELPRMLRRVDQLERELPLQTLQAQIPYENTAGGFELFNCGVTDLAPELMGWYGAPGIDPAGTTSLFLVGKGFSVHDTTVIAGGKPARFTLLSREVLRVDIPAGVATLVPPPCSADTTALARRRGFVLASATEPLPAPGTAPLPGTDGCDACGSGAGDLCLTDCNRREVVDVHLATPYGVTSHLLVPVARQTDAGGCTLAFDSACTIGLSFTITKTAGTKVESAKVDEFFTASCDAIEIAVPASFIPPTKASLRLLLRDASTGATAATFSFDDPFFDARRSRYVIAGGDLRNFIGDTSRPATDKTLRGAVKPYLDSLLAQGGLAEDGDSVPFTLSAAIVANQQEVPIGGSLAVQATRRGKTVVEPAPAPAP
ncbi:MAG: hypothetical protein K8S94_00980 [Planctomycetia bacterium]|nr:hypothetical protein [Planctomycetia bacterium]